MDGCVGRCPMNHEKVLKLGKPVLGSKILFVMTLHESTWELESFHWGEFWSSSPSLLPLSLTFWAFSSLPCPHPINPAKSHINKLWIATIATNLSHLWRFHNDSYLPSFNSTAPHTNTSQISQGFIDGQIGHLPVLNTTPDANTSQISHGCACIDVTDRSLAWWNK